MEPKPSIKALDILGRRVEVHFLSNGLNIATDDGTQLFGQYESGPDRIRIAGNASPDQIRATLVHEITHAVLGRGPDVDRLPQGEIEEAYVRLFETGWYAFLRSSANAWALKFLQQKEK